MFAKRIARRATTFLACTLALGLVACSGQRATHMIEASGARAMKRGDYQTAANEYALVIDRHPGDANARMQLGRALLELGRPAEARESLEVAYTVRPNDDEVVTLLAEAMYASGDVGDMTAELRQRAQTRNSVGDWMRLGIFQQRAGDFDGAEQALKTAARLDAGTSIGPQMALASLYREAGDDAEALLRLRMALHIEKDNPRIHELIRAYGEIPGPTFAVVPAEAE